MNENKQGDVKSSGDGKSSNLPTKVAPTKVMPTKVIPAKVIPVKVKRLTKRKKDIKENIIKPIFKKYNPLISVVLLILMIVLVVAAPDVVLPDLIVILKGVIQLLTLTIL